MPSTGKTEMAAEVTQLLVGMKQTYPNGSMALSLSDGSIQTTVVAVTSAFQTFLTNRAAVVAAQATVKAKIAAENAQMPATIALVNGFVELVRSTYGSSPETMATFAVPPRKVPAPRTAEQKAVAAAKAKATRAARAASKSATGNVTATLVVTPAAPAAAASPPAGTGSATAAKS
jgi:hypothetical protein